MKKYEITLSVDIKKQFTTTDSLTNMEQYERGNKILSAMYAKLEEMFGEDNVDPLFSWDVCEVK